MHFQIYNKSKEQKDNHDCILQPQLKYVELS